jgi:multisubunit Na+/H+ antiporter MnhB subunit
MTDASPSTSPRASGIAWLATCLFLSLLFCAAMGFAIVFDSDLTYEGFIVWTSGWGVYWLVFAPLQVRWWARGYEKFWRPVYAWSLLGFIVFSLILLPLLLWPRFRRWLFRVLKPVDPPSWNKELRVLAQLREEGILTADEFEAKKAEILGGF